ncbi:hypothetical protein BDW22DRAFT_1359354 [Trametopsis cervina]|nr:hypothetical protein BDW22DRAFT_1359354 [Trametopsis cervina]
MAAISLSDLPNEVLIDIIEFLPISGILATRQVSTHFYALSRLHIIWQRACTRHVLSRGFPFPSTRPLDALDAVELERLTRHAFRLGEFWLNLTFSSTKPAAVVEFAANSGMTVSDVHFVPAHPDWLITVSRGIWPVVTCWDTSLTSSPSCDPTVRETEKIAEWSQQGAVLTNIAVNSAVGEGSEEATLAVSMMYRDVRSVQLLVIRPADGTFERVAYIEGQYVVMGLHGDMLVISDNVNETHLVHWKIEEMPRIVLRGHIDPSGRNFQANRALQVLISPYYTFVARAHTLEAFAPSSFDLPLNSGQDNTQYPVARHGFGWIDGFAMSHPPPSPTANKSGSQPLSVVLRSESTNPWTSDVQSVEMYVIPVEQPTEEGTPHVFTPLLYGERDFPRGHLRCRDILLGPHGTALWIRPRPAHNTGLTQFDVHASTTQGSENHALVGAKEAIVAEVCAGLLLSQYYADGDGEEVVEEVGEKGPRRLRELWTLDDLNTSWTAIDYDEARGLVALGDNHGKVIVLDLVP